MSETPSSESMSDISQSSTSDTDLQEIPKPILKIKSRDGDINIIGKYKGEVSIKPINLKFIMAKFMVGKIS